MTFDTFGYDLPPSTARIPRLVPGVDRVSLYRLVPEKTPPLGLGWPRWVVPGESYDGFIQADGPVEQLIVLLQPGGEERVEVLGSWVELVAG